MKVSVVLRCFNREDVVERAIASVLEQSYQDWELIAVDDGSTDRSLDVMRSFTDNRIRVKALQRNCGPSAALNFGVSMAKGDLVAFVDSDDEWLSDFLALMVGAFTGSRGTYANFAYCWLVGGPQWDLEGSNLFGEVLRQGHLSALGTLVVRREALASVLPLPERHFGVDMCDDDRLCFELSRHGAFVLVPRPLYRAHGSINSVTKNYRVAARGWERLFRDYQDDIVENVGEQVFGQHLLGVAQRYAAAGELTTAVRLLLEAHSHGVGTGKLRVGRLLNTYVRHFVKRSLNGARRRLSRR